MTKNKHLHLLLAIFMVLSISACIFKDQNPLKGESPDSSTNEEISFQEYLWEEHTTDLFIQIGLLLGGALGVAGLLPSQDEE